METTCRSKARERHVLPFIDAALRNISKFIANARSFACGCTHEQVRSPQPQDACNLTESRRPSTRVPDARLYVAKRAVECNVAKIPHQRSPYLHSPCLAPTTLSATSVLAAVPASKYNPYALDGRITRRYRSPPARSNLVVHWNPQCWKDLLVFASDITHANDLHSKTWPRCRCYFHHTLSLHALLPDVETIQKPPRHPHLRLQQRRRGRQSPFVYRQHQLLLVQTAHA